MSDTRESYAPSLRLDLLVDGTYVQDESPESALEWLNRNSQHDDADRSKYQCSESYFLDARGRKEAIGYQATHTVGPCQGEDCTCGCHRAYCEVWLSSSPPVVASITPGSNEWLYNATADGWCRPQQSCQCIRHAQRLQVDLWAGQSYCSFRVESTLSHCAIREDR